MSSRDCYDCCVVPLKIQHEHTNLFPQALTLCCRHFRSSTTKFKNSTRPIPRRSNNSNRFFFLNACDSLLKFSVIECYFVFLYFCLWFFIIIIIIIIENWGLEKKHLCFASRKSNSDLLSGFSAGRK